MSRAPVPPAAPNAELFGTPGIPAPARHQSATAFARVFGPRRPLLGTYLPDRIAGDGR